MAMAGNFFGPVRGSGYTEPSSVLRAEASALILSAAPSLIRLSAARATFEIDQIGHVGQGCDDEVREEEMTVFLQSRQAFGVQHAQPLLIDRGETLDDKLQIGRRIGGNIDRVDQLQPLQRVEEWLAHGHAGVERT